MINRFHQFWRVFRVASLACAGLLALIGMIKCHAYSLEADYRGPGSEIERFERECRERDNHEAAERRAEGSQDRRDVERAGENEREHGV